MNLDEPVLLKDALKLRVKNQLFSILRIHLVRVRRIRGKEKVGLPEWVLYSGIQILGTADFKNEMLFRFSYDKTT